MTFFFGDPRKSRSDERRRDAWLEHAHCPDAFGLVDGVSGYADASSAASFDGKIHRHPEWLASDWAHSSVFGPSIDNRPSVAVYLSAPHTILKYLGLQADFQQARLVKAKRLCQFSRQ
jgi:hypothetical protein